MQPQAIHTLHLPLYIYSNSPPPPPPQPKINPFHLTHFYTKQVQDWDRSYTILVNKYFPKILSLACYKQKNREKIIIYEGAED